VRPDNRTNGVILGHDRALHDLEKELPPTLLLQGPPSTGKRTLANHLAKHHKFRAVDVVRMPKPAPDKVRELIRFFGTRPIGRGKVAIIDLDPATEIVLNALLKLIEEPPRCGHIIMLSSRRTLLTIESRATVYRWGVLPEDVLTVILQERMGMSAAAATAAATVSNGTIRGATQALAVVEASKPKVMSALKAASEGDEDLLAVTAQQWGSDETALLARWAHEKTTGLWRVFSPEDGASLPSSTAEHITKISGLHVRPRIALRASLGPTLENRR
jgi:DNA polymerase III delta prime subunit